MIGCICVGLVLVNISAYKLLSYVDYSICTMLIVGNFSRDAPHGEGRMDFGVIKYTGNFDMGAFHGQGTAIFPNGFKFEGIFNNNEYVKGTLTTNTHVVKSRFNNGKPYGKTVIESTENGSSFEGDYGDDGLPVRGKVTFDNGAWFISLFKNGKPFGFSHIFVPGKGETLVDIDENMRATLLELFDVQPFGEDVTESGERERVRKMQEERKEQK